MALVLPLLLLLILGGIDIDLMVTSKSALNYVAGETAVCMAHNPGCVPATFAQTPATGLGLRTASMTVTPLTPNCPAPVGVPTPCIATVTVVYAWKPISPFFRATSLTSTGSAQQ